MNPRLTCFGGVGEIGGNKFLLEDRDTRVMLDFGAGFSDGAGYFDSTISPRSVNGAGDLFEFGLLPEMKGLYSEQALQNTPIRHSPPEVDAIVLSHYHWDHVGRVGYVDPEIPVYCGETTSLIHQAYAESSSSPLEGHEIHTFRTGDRFKVGSIEFQPVHVDHSIPGAYGFVIFTSEGPIAYSGDFRFHGPAGSMTQDYIDVAKEAHPKLLLTEGTRVREDDSKENMSEKAVLDEAIKAVAETKMLVFSTFRGNDTDRVNTFNEAAKATGRRLVVSMKVAVLLEKLQTDRRLKVPAVGKDVDVYLRRKRSGRLDDSDYFPWERQFLRHGVSAQEVRKKQKETFLHLEAWNFPELVDIRPEKGGTYIHAATEAFNEEGEREEETIRNWIDHVSFSYRQIHASGHAPMDGVARLVREVGPQVVVPIHTEHPELFRGLITTQGQRLAAPSKGTPIEVQ